VADPGPPALRASDADRERTAEHLRRAAGEGRLTVEELDERLNVAYAARTQAELEVVVADVPALPEEAAAAAGRVAVRPGDDGTRWVVSVLGGSDRRGRWRVARRCTVVNVMGGADIDLNEAELAGEMIEMQVLSLMGGSDVNVPDGLNVEVSELALMGGNDVELGPSARVPGAPLLRLRLVSIMGGTTVRRGPKLSWRERRRQRRHGTFGH
jgi:hypothetical protein